MLNYFDCYISNKNGRNQLRKAAVLVGTNDLLKTGNCYIIVFIVAIVVIVIVVVSIIIINFIIPCYIIIADLPSVPETDIGFAISANAADSSTSFKKMKDTINSVIEKYGQARIRYSVIVFGSSPSVKVSFSDLHPSDLGLMSFVAAVPRSRGSNLAKTLEEVKNLFERNARPGANKVLVVMTDKQSDNSKKDLDKAAKALEEASVTVIAVALGDEANTVELENMTPDRRDFIKQPIDVDPENLAQQIMDKALKGL